MCATQPGTSAQSENPKDAVFILIPAKYGGKPRGLERFVCVKPTAVYALAMIRCSPPHKSVMCYQATNGKARPCKSKLSSEGKAKLPLSFGFLSLQYLHWSQL